MTRHLRWPYSFVFALFACSTPVACPPPSLDPCEASCAHRMAIGCLEKAFAGRCPQVCRYAAEAGLFSPECSLNTGLEGQKFCGVRCGR